MEMWVNVWVKINLKNEKKPLFKGSNSHLAETVGFEPTDALTRQLISNQSRYSHFDTSPLKSTHIL